MSTRMTAEKPLERKIQRRFLPFALVGLLAPLTALIPPQPEEWTHVWAATGLTVVIALVGLLTPWSRLPRWTWLVPPLAYFVVVALLRQANDGSVSGYAPLALLPVIWIHGESATDLVSRADAALYAAKRAGRDALVHA
jgi:hypothetical protein